MKKSSLKVVIYLSIAFILLICAQFTVGAKFLFRLIAFIMSCLAFLGLMDIYSEDNDFLKKTMKVIKIVIGIGVTVLLILFINIQYLIISNEDGDEYIPQIEYVLVLGGGVQGEEPTLMLEKRLHTALEFLEENPGSKAILCGGREKGKNLSEAESMHRWLERMGADTAQLIKEDESVNTIQNFANAKKIIDENNGGNEVAIITSGFHLYRSKLLAEKNGLTAYGIASDLPDKPLYWLNYHLREFASVILMHMKNLRVSFI